MAGDPPLEQVVARTWEAGGRGRIAPITWNVGYFHAVNRDDILFVVSEQTGFGYFRNVGETRRRGVEIGTDARKGRVSLGAGYTWLDATFRTEEAVNGTANSTNDAAASGSKGVEGTIVIEPGDRMPLVPRHVLKVYGGVDITRRLAVDVNLVAAGAAFARGNENNEHEPDGEYYLGAGRVNGYAVVSLGVQFSISPRIMATAQADNLFGREYATAAQLGAAGLTDDGAFIARPFPPEDGAFPIRHTTLLAPGAPRRGWFGMTVRF
jgi:outer membrane receptor protein involved in Fe transport